MKTRTVTLVIFLLVFASATSAMSTEGTDYQDPDFFDDLSGYATHLFNYAAPSLGPYVDRLYATACNEPSFGDIDGMPMMPVEAHQDTYLASPDLSFQPQASSQSVLGSTSPQRSYDHSQTSESQFEDVSMHEMTTENMTPYDDLHVALSEFDLQDWIDDSYTTGQRVQPTAAFPADWPGMPLYPQDQLDATMQPAPTKAKQTQPAEPALAGDLKRPRNRSLSSSSSLKCSQCNRTVRNSEGLRHHLRSHIPMHLRPHACPVKDCDRRFLCPREVKRHLPTHGLGRNFFCNVPSCPWATKGFGRRDHLTRHTLTKHAADSEIGSSLGGHSSV